MKAWPSVAMFGAAVAVAAGADALGFVFVRETPRCIRMPDAERIVAGLPPFVTTVGVFVDQSLDELLEIASRCRLQAVQLHRGFAAKHVY